MLDRFTRAPQLYVTLTNGLHTESLSPPVFGRLVEFLSLYVAKKVPELGAANLIAPILGGGLYGVSTFAPFVDRFAGQTYEQARAAFEGEPKVRVLLEQGGNPNFAPGTPEPNAVREFSSWPIPETKIVSWYIDADALTAAPPAASSSATYRADPTALPPSFYPGGGSSDIWRAGTTYDWRPIPDGTGLTFDTPPLTQDVLAIGNASLDLWISSTAADTDLEATISEVRPDGTEIFVQSGVLRVSQRALDEERATELWAAHTNREVDLATIPAGETVPVRIEILSFAHPFRAGSSLRVTVDAPGNNRPVWAFETISDGEDVTIHWGPDTPSRLVIGTVAPGELPAAPPACGSLRGQPCRPST